MKVNKAACPYCGGRLIVEFYGRYGEGHYMRKNGGVYSSRIYRRIYEPEQKRQVVYCEDCKRIIGEPNERHK